MAASKEGSGLLPPLPKPRDRRRAERHPAKLAAYLEVADDEEQHLGLVANISESGALVLTRGVFEIGEGISMKLYLPKGRALSATGRAVRSERVFDDRADLWPYQVAIEFEVGTDFGGEIADWVDQQVKLGVIKR